MKKKKTQREALTKSEMRFCALVSRGTKADRDCLVEAFPKYKNASKDTIKSQANRLMERQDIQDKIKTIKETFARKLEEEELITKKEVLKMMSDGLREYTRQSPALVNECVALIKQMSTMCGWDAPKDITLRNGGISEDYKGPPTLANLTDEEISQRLEALRESEENADGTTHSAR